VRALGPPNAKVAPHSPGVAGLAREEVNSRPMNERVPRQGRAIEFEISHPSVDVVESHNDGEEDSRRYAAPKSKSRGRFWNPRGTFVASLCHEQITVRQCGQFPKTTKVSNDVV
jgi:hypothetical protein